MNNPLILTDPSGYRPQALFEEEEMRRRNSGGSGGFNYFAGYNFYTGKFDPYHRYRSKHSMFPNAENVRRFKRVLGPIDTYTDEDGEEHIIYQDALTGQYYYEEEIVDYDTETEDDEYKANRGKAIPLPGLKAKGIKKIYYRHHVVLNNGASGGGLISNNLDNYPPWWHGAVDLFSNTFIFVDILAMSSGLSKAPGIGVVGFMLQLGKSTHEIVVNPEGEIPLESYSDLGASFVGTFLLTGGFIGGLNYLLIDKICGAEEYAEGFMNAIDLYGEYNNPVFIRSWTR